VLLRAGGARSQDLHFASFYRFFRVTVSLRKGKLLSTTPGGNWKRISARIQRVVAARTLNASRIEDLEIGLNLEASSVLYG
jgi:hypothetical protein